MAHDTRHGFSVRSDSWTQLMTKKNTNTNSSFFSGSVRTSFEDA